MQNFVTRFPHATLSTLRLSPVPSRLACARVRGMRGMRGTFVSGWALYANFLVWIFDILEIHVYVLSPDCLPALIGHLC